MKETGLDPLHLLPPLTSMLLLGALVVLMLTILIWGILYYFRTRKKTEAYIPSSPPDIRESLREIDAAAALSKDYRLSLHRISELMRRHLSRVTPFPFFSAVLFEIRRAVPTEEPVRHFFDELDQLRFARRPPTEKDYEKISGRAATLIGREGILRRLLGARRFHGATGRFFTDPGGAE